jgi:DNA ligase D-like protein (predicted 3'-phosphoesterase)
MSLEQYKKKRKFSGKNKTIEPEGKVKSSGKKSIFVIHRHHASHLHWDLRLEINNVLASWAVPKEPPISKGTKRLAIHVEDHPLEYAKFHGVIPEGNYGAGKVEIWDKGTYELKNKDAKKIEFVLHGKKLKGNFVLVKTKYGSKPEKSWLWFKTS